MSSQRLPNKVLCSIKDKVVLQYVIERVNNCRLLQGAVVATSTEKEDDRIADFCNKEGIDCYRGSLDNVASRFKEVSDRYHLDSFVRISADSPLIDQRIIDEAMEIFTQGDYDIVTNILKRTYPKGQSVEVLKSSAFRSGYGLMLEEEELEHVTSYFYKNPNKFRIFNLALEQDFSNLRLSLDTPRDLEVITSIIKRMKKPHWQYELKDILEIWQEICRSQEKPHIKI